MDKKVEAPEETDLSFSFFMRPGRFKSAHAPRTTISGNSSEDIEDLVRDTKRRKIDKEKTPKKKLHLSGAPKAISQKHVFDKCESLGKCATLLEKNNESKENCSAIINGCNSNERTCSVERNSCGSKEDLQINFEPIVDNCISSNLSTNEKSNAVDIEEENNISSKLIKSVTENISENVKELKAEANIICDADILLKTDSEASASNVPESVEEPNTSCDNYLDVDFDEWDLESLLVKDIGNLDLSKWQRCEVVQINEELPHSKKNLQLRSLNSNEFASCVLEGVWASSDIKPGTIVSVKAQCESPSIGWSVNNNHGFFVENPDLLISPTTIVGSISCMRQGVLNYLFKSSSHVVDDNSKVLASGCLIHELLQQVMVQGLDAPECIATLVEEILSSSQNVKLLYSSNMSLQEARNILLNAIPNIQTVCKRYFCGEGNVSSSARERSTSQQSDKEAWEGKINSIVAVEDNFWIPELGLKGKIDLTVAAEEKNQMQQQLMPVELKTGAAKNSVEHRGQVILYCLMAKQITPEVSGGLLLYLKEGFARKVDVGRPEQRDIVILRNKLAHYLASFLSSTTGEMMLPYPTNNSRVCEWCPQRNVCSAFLRTSKEDESFAKSEAQKLRSACIKHLTSEDINYVIHWSNLLWLEEKDRPRDNLMDLWSIPAEKREAKGRCFANLKLSGPVCCKAIDSFIHVFKRSCENKLNTSSFSTGSVVLLSTACRVAISFGVIQELNDFVVTVDVPRDLSQISNFYGDLYMIDIYEPQSYLSWVLGNLSTLLDDMETASNLRRLVINNDLPLFDTSENACKLSHKSCFTLNESQQNAIKMACTAKDYVLLRGLPGTGKSTTVAVLIQQLVLQGQSVLLTAHTHSAVDTVLLKLLELNVPFLRIGFQARVHESIHPWTETSVTKSCCTPEQLEAAYNKEPVVAATCLGIKHPLFTRRSFDVCIVDESTQVLQPIVLGPLLHAKKFILVGDPEQLPPLVRSNVAREAGLSKCLFTRLDNRGATAALNLQYRMNRKITDIANDLTYKGELKCATPTVADRTLQIVAAKIPESVPSWLLKTLSCKIEDSVLFMDVPYTKDKVSDCTNKKEALIVKKVVELFLEVGVNHGSLGVIAPYTNQVKYLAAELKNFQGIEINTVDQYQGRDKDIIIFSCTNTWSVNNTSESISCILNDKRRLNVAITRAKCKLIIIGSLPALQCFAPLKLIIDSIGCDNAIQVPDYVT